MTGQRTLTDARCELMNAAMSYTIGQSMDPDEAMDFIDFYVGGNADEYLESGWAPSFPDEWRRFIDRQNTPAPVVTPKRWKYAR